MGVLELLSERHVRIIWNFSATSHGKGPVDGSKTNQSKTVINATIQLFKHSTINVSSLLTDVLQHNVENPLLCKVLKFLLLPSIRQTDL